MLFSSMLFIWMFLPIVLFLYFISDMKYRNMVLLIASLIFYAWGEPRYIILMIISIVINYSFGIFIQEEKNIAKNKIYLISCIVINLLILAYFKYFNFVGETINVFLNRDVIEMRKIVLPIGISFYTFQALSYVIDVYRSKVNNTNEVYAKKNILDLALYITFFPQLIAGPIVKYHDIEKQIQHRDHTIQGVSYGIKRFIYGLSKKVLISNVVALVTDEIFMISPLEMGSGVAWLGIISYSIQIYFDFSGYSDMAIGLGKIFGFDFMENFNYPYISKSIQEFWRRWHISLSTWFKEYLYIPLGGNRKGEKRTYTNLLIVFFATGLWHGASWNFIFWGLWHGIFLVLERKVLGKILDNNRFKVLNSIYTLVVVLIGWVFFRANTFEYGLQYLYVLFIPTAGIEAYNLLMFINSQILIVLIVGVLFSGMIQHRFKRLAPIITDKGEVSFFEIIILVILFNMCIITLVSGAYNPFIYFRF